MPLQLQILLLTLLSFTLAQSTDTAPQSITAQPLFTAQKPCGQRCFFPDYLACPVDAVASAIGCEYGSGCPGVLKTVSYEAANDCYCRTDLQPAASRFLSSCVWNHCTAGDPSIDFSSALGLYDTYCGDKGFVIATTTAAAAASKVTGQGSFITSIQGGQSSAGMLLNSVKVLIWSSSHED